jgi:SAM-dependent methyltransferase
MKLCPSCKKCHEAADWRCPLCGFQPKTNKGFLSFLENSEQRLAGDFDPSFFTNLVRFEKISFWFKSRNELLFWVQTTFFPGAQRFFEIGMGTGYVLSGFHNRFPMLEIHGSEFFVEGLEHARTRLPKAHLYQIDARMLPFVDHFDVIGAFDVLEHIEEDQLVLAEIYKAMQAGGGLIITVPQHKFLWSVLDQVSQHKRRYSRKEIVKKLGQAGFVTIYVSSFVTFLFPIMLLSRIFRRKVNASSYTLSTSLEYRVGSVVNKIFGQIMRFERWTMRAGAKFGFGGSLLVVALKQEGHLKIGCHFRD